MNIETVINTLKTYKYTNVDGEKLTGEEGIEVSYQVKLANSLMDMETIPLQVVIYVRLNGQHAYSWGCISNEENGKFVKWFAETKVKVRNDKYEVEEKQSKDARKSFEEKLEDQYELDTVS